MLGEASSGAPPPAWRQVLLGCHVPSGVHQLRRRDLCPRRGDQKSMPHTDFVTNDHTSHLFSQGPLHPSWKSFIFLRGKSSQGLLRGPPSLLLPLLRRYIHFQILSSIWVVPFSPLGCLVCIILKINTFVYVSSYWSTCCLFISWTQIWRLGR